MNETHATNLHPESTTVKISPGERIHAHRWSFVPLAFGLGLTAGALFRVKQLRKALRYYIAIRRWI
jgi:hypothetical protein